MNSEFGEYAAVTMVDILEGRLPSDIPLTENRRSKIYLNMTIAKSLNIKFPMELIKKAEMTK